jgi:hypothetical protein
MSGAAQVGECRARALESGALDLRRRFQVAEIPLLAYSVEKLISCAQTILQVNHSVAENQV